MAQQKLKVGEIILSEKKSSKITLPLLNSKPGARLGLEMCPENPKLLS